MVSIPNNVFLLMQTLEGGSNIEELYSIMPFKRTIILFLIK